MLRKLCIFLFFILCIAFLIYSLLTVVFVHESARQTIPIPKVQFGTVGMISAKETTFFLKNAQQPVIVGDYFSVIIEARSSMGQHSKRGGDFWFGAIRSRKGNAAGKIIDFKNGTYEVIFFAGWTGKATIEIILVHPSETTNFIEEKLWPMKDRIIWSGTFSANKQYETKTCRFGKQSEHLNQCVHSYPLALGQTVFLCDKPKRLSCNTLISLKSVANHVEKKFSELLSKNNALFNKVYPSTTPLRLSIIVYFLTGSPSDVANELMLPDCKADLPTPPSDGFWIKSIWTSLQCKSKQWSKEEIKQCLKGKHVYFMGDSTTRQWNAGLLALLGLSSSSFTKSPNAKLTYHNSDVLNLTYYFYPYTISSKSCPYRIGRWEYEVMDNLSSSTCNYIIVTSPWADYSQWVKENYIERLYLLRDTILRLRERCPNTMFVVKTPKPRNHNTVTSLLYAGDRLLYDIREFFLKIFSGLGIHIIDVWDMNLAYPLPNNVHMPMEVIYQELQMFLSHVCKS
ncbi:NXPE family member 1-like [Anneissia japonica]|uniref:NXPE family member 1-like n=1 Tax=Anneissia japonica TaxID=1529436 RepID=UPI0014258FEB|nr:NXPE family member 1-like [Anneissia japonica]